MQRPARAQGRLGGPLPAPPFLLPGDPLRTPPLLVETRSQQVESGMGAEPKFPGCLAAPQRDPEGGDGVRLRTVLLALGPPQGSRA